MRDAVDIIIPVYRGLAETRRCIESVRDAKQNIPNEIIVIDDASPDPDLAAMLREFSESITLLRNDINIGFVATVNRAMMLHPERDVVLLNSDTIVSGDWLDRLHACVCREERIGTATPFSNNATICSYPRFCEDNPLPAGYSAAALDALFKKANSGMAIDIPTAVGFCMYIRRECLDEVGLFDAESFGKGYGEENDFCMRASKKGWRNLLCADTFVYHAGNVSFSSPNELKTRAMEILRTLHPDYESLIGKHVEADPARLCRQNVDMLRLRSGNGPAILFVTHNWGGGTERHVTELADLMGESAVVLILRPQAGGKLVVSRRHVDVKLVFDAEKDYPLLVKTLGLFGLARIHFHHLIALPERLMDLPADLGGLPFDFTAHDYYAVCPRINLANLLSQYCGEPDEAGCNSCLALSPSPPQTDIAAWRTKHGDFVKNAKRLFVPSMDAARRMKSRFPAANVVFAPHPEKMQETGPGARRISPSEPLRIAVLGILNPVKGADLLEACAIDARRRKLPVEFHLFGHAYRQLASFPESRLFLHGIYKPETLPTLFSEVSPHAAWFPALWPETYSYTLSECLEAGLALFVPDIGAFPERVAGRDWSWIRPWHWNARQWNDFFFSVRQEHFVTGKGPGAAPGNRPDSPFDYERDYLENAATRRFEAVAEIADMLAGRISLQSPS